MAGVLSEDMYKEMKFCTNCFIFNWKQPTMDILKRCSGCEVVWYCDDKCQKEHWHNAHKKQCKYLSNKKVKRRAKHEESTCLVCIDEARVTKEEMSRESNPILPCTMSRVNKELMNIDESFAEGVPYLALAEMTGMFHTKVEAMIAVFMRILVKMKMTKHSLWQDSRTAAFAEDMYKILWKERVAHLDWAFTFKKPGPLEGQLEFDHLRSKVFHVIVEKMAAIETLRSADDVRGTIEGEDFPLLFEPLKTLEVLTVLLRGGSAVSIAQSAADRLGIYGVTEEFGRIRITSVQSNKVRDDVLNLLSRGMVPYTTLVVDGLCGGTSVQQCYVCRKEVTVRKAAVGAITPISPGDPELLLGLTVAFTQCGSETCQEYLRDSFEARLKELSELYITLVGQHMQELCDYCGRLNEKAVGLRCGGCLTKLYCGVECQMKDVYHQPPITCQRGEKRKKKRGDDTRKVKGVKYIKKVRAKMSNAVI